MKDDRPLHHLGGADAWKCTADRDGQKVFFNSVPCFGMKWEDVDIADCWVVAAPFGGPVAVTPLPAKRGTALGGEEGIRILTAAGAAMSVIDLHASGNDYGRLHSMAWTSDLQLCVVYESGAVELYSVHGERQPGVAGAPDDYGSMRASQRVCKAAYTPSGVVLITHSGTLRAYATEGHRLDGMPTDEALLEDMVENNEIPTVVSAFNFDDDFAEDVFRNVYCYVATRLDEDAVDDVGSDLDDDDDAESGEGGGARRASARKARSPSAPADGIYFFTRYDEDTAGSKLARLNVPAAALPATAIAVSPNGRHVAIWTRAGRICMFSSDMKQFVHDFATPSGAPEAPHQLVWAGDQAVAAVLHPAQLMGVESTVLLVGLHGGHAEYSFTGCVHAVPEIDGVRIITNTESVLLEKVPKQLVETFSEGSMEPGARLLGAYVAYVNGASDAVGSIRDLKENSSRENKQELGAAIDTLIAAAGHTWMKDTQQMLLKAASYGRCFHKGDDAAAKFVEQCEALRLLNAVRAPEVGMPLSNRQYHALSPAAVIDRLIQQGLYALAYKMSTYLNLDTQKALIQWAIAKIIAVAQGRSNTSDEDLAGAIKDKFASCPTISFLDVAKTAFKVGKTQLALALLDVEPKSEIQVQLLCEMGEYDKGLLKATLSGDTDLVYWVFLKVMREGTKEQLFKTVCVHASARDIFIAYCEHQDPSLLRHFYSHEKLHQQIAMQAMNEYFDLCKTAPRSVDRHDACLGEARANFGRGSLEDKLVSEQEKLVKKQRAYCQKHGDGAFLAAENQSVFGTLRLLIKHKDIKEADELRKHLDLGSKLFYWIKLQALCEFGLWSDLETFAKQKKNPIGYMPFVQECMKYNRRQEAEKYVKKIDDWVEKVETYCDLGCIKEAVKIAEEEEQDEMLQMAILPRCRTEDERNIVRAALKRLS